MIFDDGDIEIVVGHYLIETLICSRGMSFIYRQMDVLSASG